MKTEAEIEDELFDKEVGILEDMGLLRVTDLRKAARGQPCQVRLPGICNGNPETTVLAHYRLIGISGMGLKSPDWLAAWACSDCHNAIDRRGCLSLDRDFVKLAHAEAVFRTWYARLAA